MLLTALLLAATPLAQDGTPPVDLAGRCAPDSQVFGREQQAPGYACSKMRMVVLKDDPTHVMYFFVNASDRASLFALAGYTQADGTVRLERARFGDGSGEPVVVAGSCRLTRSGDKVTRVQCNGTASDGSNRRTKIDFAVD